MFTDSKLRALFHLSISPANIIPICSLHLCPAGHLDGSAAQSAAAVPTVTVGHGAAGELVIRPWCETGPARVHPGGRRSCDDSPEPQTKLKLRPGDPGAKGPL